MFRNLTLFRIPASIRCKLESLPDRLPQHTLQPIEPHQLDTLGFVPPKGTDALSLRAGDCILFALGMETKIIPPSAVAAETAARVAALAEERPDGRVSGRDRRQIKDDVLTELRQRAIARYSRMNAYVDLRRGWLLVDTASRRMGEVMVSAIREALGSFPAQPAHANAPVRVILTDWLRAAQPADFDIGSEFTLADPADSAIVARFSGSDPDADEIRAHIGAGMLCERLGLIFSARLAFTLDAKLTIRKLQLLDTCDSEAPTDAAGTFALYSGEIGQLLDRLAFEFEIVGAE